MIKSERRECNRFELAGATVAYRIEKKLFKSNRFSDGYLPVHDISLGGVRFMSQVPLKLNEKITVRVYLQENGNTLEFKGQVAWISDYPGESYQHLVGVRFDPYGDNKHLNPPANLELLKQLEPRLT